MQSRNNLSVWLQAVPFCSDSMQQIFTGISTSVFSLVSKESISDNVPISLLKICYGKILVPTYHSTFKPLYQDIYIYPYLNICRSLYVYIYVSIHLDIIHTYLRICRYIAHHLSSHPIGHIYNRLLGPPIRPLRDFNFPFRDYRSHYDPILSPSSTKRRGEHDNQAPFMEDRYRRPPCDGRFSIALPLPLAGQKRSNFPKENRSKRRLGRASPACPHDTVRGVLRTLQGFSSPLKAV